MSYYDLSSLKNKKELYLHSPPKTSNLNNYTQNKKVENAYKFVKYSNNNDLNSPVVKIKNENKYAYSMIWKGIHYISNFLNPLPGEELETENAFVVFIKCISELIPNDEYSRHMKEFLNKYPINNLKTTTDKFKWSYKLHSYINFMRFIKNLKYHILNFSKRDIEIIINNYCVSLEMDQNQKNICTSYINNKIKLLVNENNSSDNEDYIFIENISYQEALNRYTISDTNIITKNDWGPTIWMMMHFFAANLKKEKIGIYIEFIKTLIYVIPCEECRKHLRGNLKNVPLYIDKNSNNVSIFEWSCKLHNLVNSQLKKPVFDLCKSLMYKYLDNYNSNYEYV